jgi:hypothetical protein
MVNKKKGDRILNALGDLMADINKPEVSIVGKKKALRDAVTDALNGTVASKWGEDFKEKYIPWEPPRQVNVEAIEHYAEEMIISHDPELKHLFKAWDLEDTLGI